MRNQCKDIQMVHLIPKGGLSQASSSMDSQPVTIHVVMPYILSSNAYKLEEVHSSGDSIRLSYLRGFDEHNDEKTP
jgi:hypothetical protein